LTNRRGWISPWLHYFIRLPILSLLPASAAYALARRYGRLLASRRGERTREIHRSLRRVFPDRPPEWVDKTTIRSYEIQTSEELETYWMPSWTPGNIDRVFRFDGLEVLDGIRNRGRGALLFTAHCGSFTSAVAGLGLKGYPLNYLVNDSPAEDSFHPAYRRYARFKIRTMERKSRRGFIRFRLGRADATLAEAGLKALARLRRGELVAIAVDVPPQHFQHTEEVRFLAQTCRFPAGFIKLAHAAGCPLVPFFSLRDEERWSSQVIRILDPLPGSGDVGTDLQRSVDRLGEVISAHPSQWLHWDSLAHFLIAG
jgi:lauroyl/myristoyl acyltransferase